MKRRFRRFIIFFSGGLLTVGILLYYLTVVRFKDSLRFVILKETQGKYAFEAGRAELSLWHKSIVLKESAIRCVDTTGLDARYDIQIPEMYFSLATWNDLILNRKIVVDSLSLVRPSFKLYIHKNRIRKTNSGFHTSNILTVLNKTLIHFNAHSFTLKDASFTYKLLNNAPLEIKDIDLSINNFTKVNNEDSHLLGSDKVVFSLGRQHWILPDGKKEISFGKLQFNSQGQRFEIDSFKYVQPAAEGKSAVTVYADKFLFNSQHLPAVYQKEQLLIDTLVCVNPVLTISSGSTGGGKSISINANTPLFRLINVKYIDVVNADLQMQGKKMASSNTNLRIYNLNIDPAKDPQLRTDSIRLNLQKMAFISKDSLWQLGIEEFRLEKNGALFKNVIYGPTPYNHQEKGVMFSAPALALKNLDIEALMRKRLQATDAELYRPVITLYDKRRRQLDTVHTGKMNLFYQTLHGISQLIHVENFRISNGEVHFRKKGPKSLELNVDKLNAHILLHKLFLSDSLVDIKHAIPDLRIGKLDLGPKGARIKIRNYRFDGTNRRNWGKELQIVLPNGTVLEGRDIYWEVFDWDIYQKTKDIQVNYLKLGNLLVHLKRGSHEPRSQASHKPLPVIRIFRLELDRLELESDNLELKGRYFLANNISTGKHTFIWDRLDADLYDIRVKNKVLNADVKEIRFSNYRESIIRDADLALSGKGEQTRAHFPLLRVNVPLHSTDLSQLSIPSLSAADANLELYKTSGTDTLSASAKLMFEATDLHPLKDKSTLLTYKSVDLGLRNARVKKNDIAMELPFAGLELNEGRLQKDNLNKISLASAVDLTWKDASLNFRKDSSSLAVNSFTGGLHIPSFLSSTLALKGSWKQLLDKVSVTNGRAVYQNRKIDVSVENTNWDPATKTLRLGSVKFNPARNREETFNTSKWQSDYISFRGAAITIAGINPGSGPGDSLLHIRKLTLDSVKLDVSRDKRLPFQHGIEKPMPTRLIRNLPVPLLADTIALTNSSVAYHEITAKSGQWSTIPLHAINGSVLHINSRESGPDSLRVTAAGRLFNGQIQELTYAESYSDSLSSFTAGLRLLPLDLAALGRMAMPNGAIRITSGATDTIYSRWFGNKYAAYGSMHFFYRNLRIKISSKKHPDRVGMLSAIETWLANLILPGNKQKPSLIYFERDRERFVFNYWIKTQTRGILSTIGIKSNRAYRKQYRRKQEQYSLPKEGAFNSLP